MSDPAVGTNESAEQADKEQPLAPLVQDSADHTIAPSQNGTANGAPVKESAAATDTSTSPPIDTQTTVKTNFVHPAPECKPTPRPGLTPEQETKYKEVLAIVEAWKEVPNSTARDATQTPITETERMWLTRECLLRYLRATTWNTVEAHKRLHSTLVWRREYGVLGFTADYISEENATGKQFILGYDNAARPCLYMTPSQQNTKKSERQIQHLVFMLERVIELMVPDQETIALLISFKGASQGQNASMAQARQTLNILQYHYPERLGRAYVADVPWIINAFFKLITPFIDPVTRQKLYFNADLRQHVPVTQLDKRLGGDCDFVYEHDVYWPDLNKLCDERRLAQKERWEKAGSRIGEYESYLRGGDQKSLAEVEKETTAEPVPTSTDPETATAEPTA